MYCIWIYIIILVIRFVFYVFDNMSFITLFHIPIPAIPIIYNISYYNSIMLYYLKLCKQYIGNMYTVIYIYIYS